MGQAERSGKAAAAVDRRRRRKEKGAGKGDEEDSKRLGGGDGRHHTSTRHDSDAPTAHYEKDVGAHTPTRQTESTGEGKTKEKPRQAERGDGERWGVDAVRVRTLRTHAGDVHVHDFLLSSVFFFFSVSIARLRGVSASLSSLCEPRVQRILLHDLLMSYARLQYRYPAPTGAGDVATWRQQREGDESGCATMAGVRGLPERSTALPRDGSRGGQHTPFRRGGDRVPEKRE